MKPRKYQIENYKELLRGCGAYIKDEPRDAMYKIATYIITQFWGNLREITDGLGVLLLTWNQAFYRYGHFNFDRLEACIGKWWSDIEKYRNRELGSLSSEEEDKIKELFHDFLESLERKNDKAKSPVAVAKAIHLLAPRFFPLWDDEIAKKYGCYWYADTDRSPKKYVEFMRRIKSNVEQVSESYMKECNVDRKTAQENIVKLHPTPKPYLTILKLIDEYNYAKHTKGWI